MKKLLAAALAVIMTCSLMTACGNDESSSDNSPADDSSPAATTTTVPAETTTAPDTTTTVPEAEVEQPRDISEVADELKYNEEASISFADMTEVPAYVSMFNEAKTDADGNEVYPGDEGYTGDEAVLDIALEELAGIQMLRVDDLPKEDGTYVGTKLRFDMNQIFEGQEDKLAEIFKVSADLIVVAKDEATSEDGTTALVPAWNGGAFGTNNNGDWNGNMASWECNEWVSEWAYIDLQITPGIYGAESTATFNASYETNYLTLMMWAPSHDVQIYVADIQFTNEAGEVITLD